MPSSPDAASKRPKPVGESCAAWNAFVTDALTAIVATRALMAPDQWSGGVKVIVKATSHSLALGASTQTNDCAPGIAPLCRHCMRWTSIANWSLKKTPAIRLKKHWSCSQAVSPERFRESSWRRGQCVRFRRSPRGEQSPMDVSRSLGITATERRRVMLGTDLIGGGLSSRPSLDDPCTPVLHCRLHA